MPSSDSETVTTFTWHPFGDEKLDVTLPPSYLRSNLSLSLNAYISGANIRDRGTCGMFQSAQLTYRDVLRSGEDEDEEEDQVRSGEMEMEMEMKMEMKMEICCTVGI